MADAVETATTTDSSASGAAAVSTGKSSVSSGTASEAMIKAAMATEGVTNKPAEPKVASATAATDTKVPLGTDGKPSTEPPKERWDDILKNARTKASEEAVAPFAWAKGLKADEVSAAIDLVNTLRKDPAAFWRELGTMVEGTRETKPAKEEAFPDPDLISSDGVKAYSADTLKQTLDIFKRQLMATFQGELRPLMEFRDGEVATRERATATHNARTLAGQALTSARALPHFKEHEAAIVETLTKMDPAIRKAVGPIAAMYMAFEQVKQEKVYPTLKAEAEKTVRAEYDKKAAASGVRPIGSDGKVAETPVIKGQNGLAAHIERLSKSNDPRFTTA